MGRPPSVTVNTNYGPIEVAADWGVLSHTPIVTITDLSTGRESIALHQSDWTAVMAAVRQAFRDIQHPDYHEEDPRP